MDPTDTSARSDAHRQIAERLIGSLAVVSSPELSPDGRRVAFVVTRTDLAANTYRSSIWIADTDGGAPARPLTSGDPGERQPAWSPCGRFLAFASSRATTSSPAKPGATSLHVIPVDGAGEVRTVATLPDSVADLRWSPDGAWLGCTARTPDERYSQPDESWQAPRRIDTFFTRLDGVGWTVDRPSHVYVVPSSGLAAPRNLTPGPSQHGGLAWLADSSGVVTAAGRHDTWDRDLAVDLHRVDLDGTVTTLTDSTCALHSPSVSPDGTRVAYLGVDDPLTYPQNARVGVLDLSTQERRWVSTGLDRTFESTSGAVRPIWIDDDTLLATAEDRGTGHVVRLRADGSAAPEWVTSGRRWIRGLSYAQGLLAMPVATVDRPAELVLRPLDAAPDDVDVERTVTDVGAALRTVAPPLSWEHLEVQSADGTVALDAWVMLPADLAEGTTAPVLLNVHGGPHTQYGETYFDEAQMQAAAGFVVVMCNPRGSSGREQTFGQAILGPKHPVAPGSGWGSVDVDDVMSVLDAVLDRYPACDRNRVGMLGGSYGGFMATELAGRFGDRFRAICSERAVNNMLSEEWSSDIATIFRAEHGPDHVSDPDEYARLSPMRLVHDIHVPMLLIHSENDLRCPISQAEELFVALRTLEREVVLYRFPAEGHELSRSGSPVHRRQRAEIILDWFAEKLA